MNKIAVFIKKRKYWLLLLVVGLGLIGYGYFRSQRQAPVNFVTVFRGEVVSEVGTTGKVKPARSLDLAFEKSGRISRVYVEVGDPVGDGEILVTLDNSEISAQLAEARAGLQSEKAKLVQLKKGTRPEDIRVKQSELEKAEQDLANYYTGAPAVLADAYSRAEDAVRQQIASLFSNAEEINPQLTFNVFDSQIKTDAELQRFLASAELNQWKEELEKLPNESRAVVIDASVGKAKSHLTFIAGFLDKTMEAVIKSAALSQSAASSHKTSIAAARSAVNTALTNVSNLEQSIASQKVTVQKIRDELNLKLAGSLPEEIAAQEAKVSQAEANIGYYEAQIAKTILRAPFSGRVTKVDFDPGDIPPVNQPVISLIGQGVYQIEANIPESDIAKIKVGNTAEATLDAYGPDLVFEAKIIQIDLAATILEDVATYKTILQFTKEDPRILAGLTANLEILNERRENVLYAPTRNIITEDGRKFVKVLRADMSGSAEKVEIKIGLRSSDGKTEVVEGLKEEENIVIE